MAEVHTVRGAVSAADLGPTLAHEHVVIRDHEFSELYPEHQWNGLPREQALAETAALLEQVKESGIDTIIDCTALTHGRDVPFLKDVNAMVDLHIIASTGIYSYDELPHMMMFRKNVEDLLTDMFLRDITTGIGDTGVRAGMIKIAVDRPGITINIRKMMGAAARACQETRTPVTIHTHPAGGLGQEILDWMIKFGADPQLIVMSHSGDSADLDYLRGLMDRGAVIASDRFGLNTPGTASEAERIEVIAQLCSEGYADRIVVGHDAMMCHDWGPQLHVGRETWEPTRVGRVIVPSLREHGVSTDDLQQIMTTTPARLVAGGAL